MSGASFAFHPEVESDLDTFIPRPAHIRKQLGELYQRVCDLLLQEHIEVPTDQYDVIDGARLFTLTHDGDDYSIVAYVALIGASAIGLLFAYVDTPDAFAQARTLARERLLNL
jgi:hypothetical protein